MSGFSRSSRGHCFGCLSWWLQIVACLPLFCFLSVTSILWLYTTNPQRLPSLPVASSNQLGFNRTNMSAHGLVLACGGLWYFCHLNQSRDRHKTSFLITIKEYWNYRITDCKWALETTQLNSKQAKENLVLQTGCISLITAKKYLTKAT